MIDAKTKQVVDIRELPNYSELNTMTLLLFLLNDVTETALMNLLQERKTHRSL